MGKLLYYILCFWIIFSHPMTYADTLNPTGLFICPSPEGRKTQIIAPDPEDEGTYHLTEMTPDREIISKQILFKTADQEVAGPAIAAAHKRIQLFRFAESQTILYYSITQSEGQYIHQIVEENKSPIYFTCEMISPRPSLSELPESLEQAMNWPMSWQISWPMRKQSLANQMSAIDLLLYDSPLHQTQKGADKEEELPPPSPVLMEMEPVDMGVNMTSDIRRQEQDLPFQGASCTPIYNPSYNPRPSHRAHPNRIVVTREKLGIRALYSLIKQIRATPNLEDLRLKGVKVRTWELRQILRALGDSHRLRNLRFWGTGIDDRGARAIARFLSQNRSLRTLTLRGNEISDVGFREILKALHQGSPLIGLDLFGNQISIEGARELWGAPPRYLLFINLYNNRIQQTKSKTFQKIHEKWRCPPQDVLKILDDESEEDR